MDNETNRRPQRAIAETAQTKTRPQPHYSTIPEIGRNAMLNSNGGLHGS